MSELCKVMPAAVLAWVALGWSAHGAERVPASRVCAGCNLVLISVDSLRRDHVGFYGYPRPTTPNLDQLAEKSWVLDQFYSTGYLTPVSEVSVHTGLYPDTTGINSLRSAWKNGFKTVGRILADNGYHTGAFGDSVEFSEYWPPLRDFFVQGFDTYEVTPARVIFDKLWYQRIKEFMLRTGDHPFYLWVAIGSVHAPFGFEKPNEFADEHYVGAFRGIQFFANMQYYYDGFVYDPRQPGRQFRLSLMGRSVTDDAHQLDADLAGPFPKKVDANDFVYLNGIYDNGVAYADGVIGALVNLLRDMGRLESTVIVVESEHGETLGERKYVAHTDIHEEIVHVPALIYSPKLTPRRIDDFVSGIDILPSLLQHLDVPCPAYPLDGQSIFDHSKTPVEPVHVRDEVYFVRTPLWETGLSVDQPNSPFEQLRAHQELIGHRLKDYGVKDRRHKLIHRRSRFAEEQFSAWTFISGKRLSIPEYEFFDVKKDPLELNPIPAVGAEFEDLKAKLSQFEKIYAPRGSPDLENLILQDYR